MTSASALPPVRKSIVVPLDAAAAFDLFVRRLPEWWPLSKRSVGLENALSCHVEPRVGGKLFERGRDGSESTWGTFQVVDEPTRVVMTWHPGLPATAATRVEVTFTPLEGHTRVDVEHHDWERLGARASFVRGLYEGGWVGVLGRYLALARDAALPDVGDGPGCIPRDGDGGGGGD